MRPVYNSSNLFSQGWEKDYLLENIGLAQKAQQPTPLKKKLNQLCYKETILNITKSQTYEMQWKTQ